MSKKRIPITGYLPAATRWDTDYLGFDGVTRSRRIGDVLAAWPLDTPDENYSALTGWIGGEAEVYDFDKGRDVFRQSFIGFAVTGRHTIKDRTFFCLHVIAEANFVSFPDTSGIVGTSGVVEHRESTDVIQAYPITGITGEQTGWIRF